MNRQIALTNAASATRALYDEYGGLLLGYITEVVKDETIAGQYLISVFNELPQHLPDILKPGVNKYLQLVALARKVLAVFFETIPACKPGDENFHTPVKPNRFLDRMSQQQRLIFCSVHFNGKSISTLAAELNQTELEIKKTLQQAFAAIRRSA